MNRFRRWAAAVGLAMLLVAGVGGAVTSGNSWYGADHGGSTVAGNSWYHVER